MAARMALRMRVLPAVNSLLRSAQFSLPL